MEAERARIEAARRRNLEFVRAYERPGSAQEIQATC